MNGNNHMQPRLGSIRLHWIAVLAGIVLAAMSFDYVSRLGDSLSGKRRSEDSHDGGIGIHPLEIIESQTREKALIRTLSFELFEVSWTTGQARRIKPFANHRVYRVVVSGDGSTIAVGLINGTTEVWNRRSGRRCELSPKFTNQIIALACSFDGSFVAAADSGGNFRIWNTKNDSLSVIRNSSNGSVLAIAFTNGNRTVVTYENTGRIQLYDLATNTVKTAFKAAPVQAVRIAVGPDGRELVASDARGVTSCLSLHNGRLNWSDRQRQPIVPTLAVSPDGRYVATRARYGRIELRGITTGHLIDSFAWPKMVRSIAFSRDGLHLLITHSVRREICRFDLKRKQADSTIAFDSYY